MVLNNPKCEPHQQVINRVLSNAYHVKENSNQFLRLSSEFRCQCGRGDVKECAFAFSGHRFGQQRFTRSWRTDQKHTLPRSSDPLSNKSS